MLIEFISSDNQDFSFYVEIKEELTDEQINKIKNYFYFLTNINIKKEDYDTDELFVDAMMKKISRKMKFHYEIKHITADATIWL